ncbi:MAG: 4Fe-4S binding protein [Enterocloster asparagiformis]|nr:4Fe-4S binding protein [Enterocloster asparagiformis]
MAPKRLAAVDQARCVACGCCAKVCPRQAIRIANGCFAAVDSALCIGCGKCEKECPACIISMNQRQTSEGGAA